MGKKTNNPAPAKSAHFLSNKKHQKFFKLLNAAISSYELTVSNIYHKKFSINFNFEDSTYYFDQVLRAYINSDETFQRKQYAIIAISEKKWESLFRTDELDATDQRNIMHYVQNWVRPDKEVPHTVLTCYCKFIVPTKKTEIVFEIARISINDQRVIAKKIQEEIKRVELEKIAKIDSTITKLVGKKKKIEGQIKGNSKFNQKNYNANLAMLAGTDARETELAVQSSKQVSEQDKLRMSLGENSTGQHSGPTVLGKDGLFFNSLCPVM